MTEELFAVLAIAVPGALVLLAALALGYNVKIWKHPKRHQEEEELD